MGKKLPKYKKYKRISGAVTHANAAEAGSISYPNTV
jgi:hypothetical protein